jgi:tetratricopeptide (TPR) repeat protein
MALQLFAESLRIRVDNLGREHRDVSFTMYNVALCYQMQGELRQAIKCYQETLRIERLVLGENHKDISMTCFKLGEVYAANNETDKALGCFQSSLRVEQELNEDADPATVARILNEIGNIYLAQGKTEHMVQSLIEAARVLKKAGLPPFDGLTLPDRLYAFGVSCPSSAPAA